MERSTEPDGSERRTSERIPYAGQVTVRIDGAPMQGPGQNISDGGVYFVADGVVQVTVEIEGREPLRGELVRVAAMGEGKTGIAVRFHDDPEG